MSNLLAQLGAGGIVAYVGCRAVTAFAYEHFVEGFQPDVEGGNMVFRRREGGLRELADRVVQTGKRHFLLSQ